MKRRIFLKQSTIAAGAILTLPIHSSAYAFNENDEVIIGHNSHKYKVDMSWGNLDPDVVPVKDCHEMVQDAKGRIVLLTNHTKNNIIIYDKDGNLLETWGTTYPGAHGLTLFHENGEDFLFITDTERNQVIKTTIDGKELFTVEYPKETGKYTKKEEFKPTETAVLPNGEFYVADGYGLQYIIHYDRNGKVLNVFGGRGEGDENFNNAHGICLDDRDKDNPVLLITARQQNALKRFSLKGEYLSTISVDGAWICRPVVHKDHVYFAVLQSNNKNQSESGFLLIMNENNEVVSCPGATEPVYEAGDLNELYQTIRLFKYPHDVCIDDEDNMYVAQWNSGNIYPIKLTRIKE